MVSTASMGCSQRVISGERLVSGGAWLSWQYDERRTSGDVCWVQ